MSGSRDIGRIATAKTSGSTAITSCEDTEPRVVYHRDVSGLPGRDQSTQQTEKSANERFQKIMAL